MAKLQKGRPCKTLITTQKHKSTQRLGKLYLLLYHVQNKTDFFSFHTLILNPKISLAYKNETELKF